MTLTSLYHRKLTSIFRGRKCVIVLGSLADSLPQVRALIRLGAEKPFIIANGIGMGPLPSPEEAEWQVYDEPAADIVAFFRQFRDYLAEAPPELEERLDGYDPDKQALVLVHSLFATSEIAGRKVFAPQHPSWVAAEDKAIVDEIWDELGVARAPSETLPVDSPELSAAIRRLNWGSGAILSGDSRDGLNGAAGLVRWVRNEKDRRDAVDFFRYRCNRVRVMPFLEGIPCSIHAMAFEQSIIAFRPVEMIVMRDLRRSGLQYMGGATFWDPPAEQRSLMQRTARLAGRHLSRSLRYRGVFTVDGIMTAKGFFPTEINTRYGVAMHLIAAACPEIPLWLVDQIVRRGESGDYHEAELEAALTSAADEQRAANAWAFLDSPMEKVTEHPFSLGTLVTGPSPLGGIVAFRPHDGAIPVGASIAPYVARAMTYSNERLGTTLSALNPAMDAITWCDSVSQ